MWKDSSQMSSGHNHECKACSSLSLGYSCSQMASERSLLCRGDISLCGCFPPFEAQDHKSLRREVDVEGLRHQWPTRMNGLERAELTENSLGDASRGIGRRTLSAWCGITAQCRDWLCLFHDLLTSHPSSLKNTISLIAAWVILTRTCHWALGIVIY